MVCPKCDAFISEDAQVCPHCGNDLTASEKADKASAKASQKKGAGKKKLIFKLVLLGIAIVLSVILCIQVLNWVSGSKGAKLASSLSENLGRSIAAAETNTGVTLAASSENELLREVVSFNHLIEAEKTVTVEGIRLPEWAVFVSVDENDKISRVTYYDFKLLSHDWKGAKTSERIPVSEIEYGMTQKEAQKILSIQPVCVVYSNDDVTAYQYKYYYMDKEDKSARAYNLTVHYDVSGTVTDISDRENDYISYFLKFGEQ